ncbi:MAG: outer membrane beta-barrel protein [Chitinophagaceae bacterium]|nr:outer membrane beta-barrel protein [Chitinophagaceae bacterium]
MRAVYTILFFLSISFAIQAQQPAVSGRVYDTVLKKGLAYTTVSLVDHKDSTLVAFSRADSTGKFVIREIPKPGKYLLSTSYVGYLPVWLPVELKQGEHLQVGNVVVSDLASMSSVTVNARRPPVEMKNDTLEFNTENFKTQPNAVVEDMLKRLPGVTVDRDGTVRVNGQQVRSVLVNGKEFFTGDPKLATKNLNADWVDKVQVFDRKSDRSQFTGMDDGQSEKAINLKLKKDKNKATFGRVTAAGGTESRFDAQANVNRFNGDKQLSFLGMANNTNRQGFSLSDILNFNGELQRGMRSGGGGISIRIGAGEDYGLPVTGMGQNQQGVANTYAGGLNFNDKWNKKTDVNGNALISDTRLLTERNTNRQNLFPGNNFNYQSSAITNRDAQQQRFGMTIDHQFDSANSLRVVPQLTFQQGNTQTLNTYRSDAVNGQPINNGFSDNRNQTAAMNFSNNMLYRKKFKKKGRTFSATLNMAYNESALEGSLYTKNTFYAAGIPVKDSILNQRATRDAVARSLNSSATFTEQLGKRSLLELTGYYNTSSGNSDRKTRDFNAGTGKYDVDNLILSNAFANRNTVAGGTVGLRTNYKKLNAGIAASAQQTNLISENKTTGTNIEQNFADILPSANMRYAFNSKATVNINYNTSTQQPSTAQLQPVPDVSDPLNVSAGNPDLRRSYIHSLTASFTNLNIARGRNLFLVASLNKTNNAIVNSDMIQANGSRFSKPVNADGVFFAFANLNSGFNLKKLKSRVDIGVGVNHSNNVSFVNNQRNEIANTSVSPNISWTFSLENKIDVFASGRLNISKAAYSLQPQLNNRFLQQVYTIEMVNYLPGNLIFNNNLTYTVNSGRADGFNTKVPYWTASVAKSFLKNKRAEVKLSAFDLLNQNVGITRNANQNYVEDVRYNVLQRYFTLGFTFILNKSGTASAGPRFAFRTLN